MSFFYENPEYTKALPRWKKVLDVIEGEEALKSADRAALGTYLPELLDRKSVV